MQRHKNPPTVKTEDPGMAPVGPAGPGVTPPLLEVQEAWRKAVEKHWEQGETKGRSYLPVTVDIF